MTKLKTMARVLFGRRSASKHDEMIKHWARVEYKKDWEYAYNYMREHGEAPRHVNVCIK